MKTRLIEIYGVAEADDTDMNHTKKSTRLKTFVKVSEIGWRFTVNLITMIDVFEI